MYVAYLQSNVIKHFTLNVQLDVHMYAAYAQSYIIKNFE